MTRQVRRIGSAALACLVLSAWQASSQTHYETGGRVSKPDLFEEDGFRPVWQQQQQQQKARQAQQRAQQKAKAEKDRLAAEQSKQGGTPAEGQPVRTETTQFDQWSVTCREIPSSKQRRTCTATLRVLQPNQQVVLLWEVTRGANGVVQGVMQTPTGVFVRRPVELRVGNALVGRLIYVACVPQNCEATGVLDGRLVGRLAAAGEMTVTIFSRDGRDIHFKFPIKGIDKAIAAVRS